MYLVMAERGQPLPPEANEPERTGDPYIEDWYMRAFHRLSSCRDYSFGAGPIPWVAIDRYSDRHGLDEQNHQVFEDVIYQMDSAYLKWEAAEAKKREKK